MEQLRAAIFQLSDEATLRRAVLALQKLQVASVLLSDHDRAVSIATPSEHGVAKYLSAVVGASTAQPVPAAILLRRALRIGRATSAQAVLITEQAAILTAAQELALPVVWRAEQPGEWDAGPFAPLLAATDTDLLALLAARALIGGAPGTREPVSIRPATADDAPAILWITRAAFAEQWGRVQPPSSAHREQLDRARREIAAGAAVAEAAGRPVGTVRFETERDWLYLGRLAVLPGWRKQGIGRQLTAYVEAEARRQGKPAVRLGVRLPLVETRTYYERQGYHVIGLETHPGYAEPTFAWLQKELTPGQTGS